MAFECDSQEVCAGGRGPCPAEMCDWRSRRQIPASSVATYCSPTPRANR